MNKKLFALVISALLIMTSVYGCGSDKNPDTNTTPKTSATASAEEKEKQLKKEISDCVAAIAKADKTNALEDELVKYPEYYYNSENGFASLDELKECIKKYFYTCDTEYKVLSVKDVTKSKKSEMEKDLKENYGANLNIEQAAVADINYKYTNYSTHEYIDDIDFKKETQYFIKIDGKWYYGWGLDLNSEHYEIES